MSASAQNPAPDVKPSTMEGLVVNSVTGKPLKKALVVAQRILEGRGAAGQALPSQVAQTSADGRFVLTVPPGAYSLRVTRNGYLDQSYRQTNPPGSPGATGVTGPSGAITLGPEQHVTDLVFKLVPMGIMTGRVLDEDGEPLRNISVQALRRSYSSGRLQLVSAASASTNDLGMYRLIGLNPAKYYVCALYNGYVAPTAKEHYVPVCYKGSIGVGAATPVDVSPGQEVARVDLDLKPVRTVGVRGKASVGASGEGVSGANVMLMRRETPWAGSQMRATTDSGGRFELRSVPPGAYVLLASWFDKNKRSSGRMTLEIGNEDVQDVALVLNPGFDVAGTLRIEESGAKVTLAGLRINVQPLEPFEPATPAARVDPAGAFVLKDVPAGSYAISVCCPGEDVYLKAASRGGKSVLEEGLTVAAAAAQDSLDLLLAPMGGHIEGTVLRDKKPFAGATVALVPEANRRGQARLYFDTATDQAGRFVLRGVPPGSYKLFAWERIEEGAFRDADTLRRYEALGKPVRVDEQSKLTVDVPLIAATNSK